MEIFGCSLFAICSENEKNIDEKQSQFEIIGLSPHPTPTHKMPLHYEVKLLLLVFSPFSTENFLVSDTNEFNLTLVHSIS